MKRFQIRKKRYFLRFTKMAKGVFGECDPPTIPNKEIRISEKLKGVDLLDTLLHEMMHGGYWDLDESAIEELATDMARILWALGYRAPWDLEHGDIEQWLRTDSRRA